ncbi:hypothetical protein FHS96_004947 [Sphingomonas zeicaulis]|uniref:Lar family restriction alleviation protein n=1 Tax=Sphingomonas zeicaulis TaxID=1632740 RepID=UPI003D1ABF1A
MADTPFVREERYIVIKRKHLDDSQETAVRALLTEQGIGIVECAVVESDWPEYEPVWKMIEDRVAGVLKSCPFCDSEADYEHLENGRWSIGCVDPAGNCMGFQTLQTFATQAEARRAWNTRANPTEQISGEHTFSIKIADVSE